MADSPVLISVPTPPPIFNGGGGGSSSSSSSSSSNSTENGNTGSGNIRTAANAATAAESSGRRFTSLLMSSRKPAFRLTLSAAEQADFSAAIQQARGQMVSDAAKLPASTNMGLGNRPPPAGPVAPASMAQPIGQAEQARIPTQREKEKASRDARSIAMLNWEEDDAEPRAVRRAAASNAVFLQAIPCIFVSSVKSATSFYKDILGFEVLGKPDVSHASLYRAPPNSPPRRGIQSGKMEAPAGSVEMYLRIAPMGSDGIRSKPPPVTLWILVNDVDEVFKEISQKWSRFQPKENEYFPTHLFGEARILSKPQNKAWGTRELHLVDGDENKIIFFKNIH